MSSDSSRFNKWLHRYAVFTALSTLFLLMAGGLVTSTGSGLAVPDWPLSYGQIMPPMVGGILYEHGHRMVAAIVGMLTVGLAIWLSRKESRRWVRRLGYAAVAAVIFQGLLGGLTVLFLLPTPISVSHATLAQSFFCLVVSIALFTSRWWHSELPVIEGEKSMLALSLATTAAIFIQLILGAVMRHTQSGLAIPDFPLAYGQMFPSLNNDALERYNQFLLRSDMRIAADGPISAGQILIHLLHRYWALIVSVLTLWTVIRSKRLKRTHGRLKFLARLLGSLVLVQFGLGAVTVLTHKAVVPVTAHVVTGAVVLALSVLLTIHVVRLQRISLSSLSLMRAHRREALA